MWIGSLGQEDPLGEEMATTPVFLHGYSHGQKSLAGYSPRGHKESDRTKYACMCKIWHLGILFPKRASILHSCLYAHPLQWDVTGSPIRRWNLFLYFFASGQYNVVEGVACPFWLKGSRSLLRFAFLLELLQHESKFRTVCSRVKIERNKASHPSWHISRLANLQLAC